MACKNILGVQKQTMNVAVLLELGRIPMQIFAVKAAIKNWERINQGKRISPLAISYRSNITNTQQGEPSQQSNTRTIPLYPQTNIQRTLQHFS